MNEAEPANSLPSPTDDPEAALNAAVALRRLADRLEAESVQAAIDQGWTWAEVAQALGVTRQAAHKKHAGRRKPDRTTRKRK